MLLYKTEVSYFNITREIFDVIGEISSFFLTKNGLPQKIIYQEYSFHHVPKFQNDEIILGQTIGDVNPHELIIRIDNKAIYHKWNFDIHNPSYIYLGQSVESLSKALFINDFVVKRMILSGTLGTYHENHDKYATLLKEMIVDIEGEGILDSAWGNLIDEMRLGVI
jgi:hypothetical protein